MKLPIVPEERIAYGLLQAFDPRMLVIFDLKMLAPSERIIDYRINFAKENEALRINLNSPVHASHFFRLQIDNESLRVAPIAIWSGI
ncbi:hypothetical protein ASD79_18510 [Caulobacter sp. Root655]|nr:hypothetical protein ASD79_18510 [Caulobacter sp. Root655]